MILPFGRWVTRHAPGWWWPAHGAWLGVCAVFVYAAWCAGYFWLGAAWGFCAGLAVQSMVVRPLYVAFRNTVNESLDLTQRMGAATDRWAELNAAMQRSFVAVSSECMSHLPGEERLAGEIMRILSRPVGDAPNQPM